MPRDEEERRLWNLSFGVLLPQTLHENSSYFGVFHSFIHRRLWVTEKCQKSLGPRKQRHVIEIVPANSSTNKNDYELLVLRTRVPSESMERPLNNSPQRELPRSRELCCIRAVIWLRLPVRPCPTWCIGLQPFGHCVIPPYRWKLYDHVREVAHLNLIRI